MNAIFKSKVFSASALTLPMLASLSVHAAGPAPDSGSILQQLQPAIPALPSSGAPSLQLKPKDALPLADSPPFEVKAIRITGNTVFPTEVLHALVLAEEGRELSLSQLEALAARVTAYYQERGFPLTRAMIPAQTVQDGTVVIRVVEARYGEISLANSSRVSERLLSSTASALRKGDLITERTLDRTLLLLSDVPGTGLGATLKPGATSGTADLDIAVAPGAAATGELTLDNYGNQYVGRARAGGIASLINPFRQGDILSAAIVTTGSDMNYGRVSYDTLLNGLGLRSGVSYSAVRYVLGRSLSSLEANGTAEVASLWVRQPLWRGRQMNLVAQLQYDAKRLRDHIDSTSVRNDRHLDNLVLSVSGDVRDDLLAGGVSIWSLGWTRGRLAFDDAVAESADASSANTRGHFSKWNANFSRIQSLSVKDTLYLNLAAQWADGNLDTSEKIAVGGPATVRAYDIGSISADRGYFGTLELRRDLGTYYSGRWQALGFVDAAHVTVNHQAWSNGQNTASLSGAGIGLNWSGPGQWKASASLAARLGDAPSLISSAASVRAWVTLSKAF